MTLLVTFAGETIYFPAAGTPKEKQERNREIIKAKENGIKIIVKNFILNSNETVISSTPSSKKVLGFILFNNQYSLATFNPQEVMDILDEKFKKSHIFIKNYVINKQCLSFLISSSQALLIRTIILKTFFSDMVK